MAIRLVA